MGETEWFFLKSQLGCRTKFKHKLHRFWRSNPRFWREDCCIFQLYVSLLIGPDPPIAETWAFWKALNLCQDLGMHHMIFEGDCMHVVLAVQGKKTKDDILGPIIFDILYLLNYNLGWSVVYVSREANFTAHNLAKLSSNSIMNSIWIEECPEGILPFVLADNLCSISVEWTRNIFPDFKKKKERNDKREECVPIFQPIW